jgi:putative flippase GtrA
MSPLRAQVLRYIINGLAATALHFAILTFNLDVLKIPSAGLANFIAACIAITVSFFTSRHFVFRAAHAPVVPQAVAFGVMYALLAVAHGVILYLWTDRAGLDYRIGFLLGTCVQVVGSFIGNKLLVFKT